jgi:hypothetical protein
MAKYEHPSGKTVGKVKGFLQRERVVVANVMRCRSGPRCTLMLSGVRIESHRNVRIVGANS